MPPILARMSGTLNSIYVSSVNEYCTSLMSLAYPAYIPPLLCFVHLYYFEGVTLHFSEENLCPLRTNEIFLL